MPTLPQAYWLHSRVLYWTKLEERQRTVFPDEGIALQASRLPALPCNGFTGSQTQCLTLRSSRLATTGHSRPPFHSGPFVPSRRSRLNFDVRPQGTTLLRTRRSSSMSVCPACGSDSISRIEPVVVSLHLPTHKCTSCGARLTTRLGVGAIAYVVVGFGLMLTVMLLHEASKSVPELSAGIRAIAAVSLLAGVFGFAANRVLRNIEFRLWRPRS